MQPGSIWDHDLWADVYAVSDSQTKKVLVQLYRLVLDMRNNDVLAQQIADKVSRRDKLILSVGVKVWGVIFTGLLVADTILHIIHGGH